MNRRIAGIATLLALGTVGLGVVTAPALAGTLAMAAIHENGGRVQVNRHLPYRLIQAGHGLVIVDFPGTRMTGFRQLDVRRDGIRRIRIGNVRPGVGRLVLETDPRLVFRATNGADGLVLAPSNTESIGALSSEPQSQLYDPDHHLVSGPEVASLPADAAPAHAVVPHHVASKHPVTRVAEATPAPVPVKPTAAQHHATVPPQAHHVAEAPPLPPGMSTHPPMGNAMAGAMDPQMMMMQQMMMKTPMGPIAALLKPYLGCKH